MAMTVEERIDGTLAAIGATEPPAGLEGRVLARLAEVRGMEARGLQIRRGGWLRVGVACACVGLVAAGIVVRREGSARSPSVLMGRGARGQSEGEASFLVRRDYRSARPGAFAERHGLKAEGASMDRGAAPGRRVAGPERRASGGEREESVDDAAVSEMLAPSQPAPMEPLTAQERMLQRAGRAPGVSALAEPDPEAAAALLAAQAARQAEVRTLFAAFGKSLFAGMDGEAMNGE